MKLSKQTEQILKTLMDHTRQSKEQIIEIIVADFQKKRIERFKNEK